MVNWQTDHFTFRADEEIRKLIRRNKDFLEENYNSTAEIAKEAFRYVDNQNGTLQDKIDHLEQKEKQMQEEMTETRQRRKELEEKKERLEKKRRKQELEERIEELQRFEGKTQEDIEEEVIEELIEKKSDLECRQDVLDSRYEIKPTVQRRLEKVEELNEKKKELQVIDVE